MTASKKKKPIGRPPKYGPAVVAKAEAYIEEYECVHGHAIPSIAGLAIVLEVNRETCHRWGNEKPEFSNMLDKIAATQEMTLLAKGLKGEFNANLSKLVLSKHGYHDLSKTELSTPVGEGGFHFNISVNAVGPE